MAAAEIGGAERSERAEKDGHGAELGRRSEGLDGQGAPQAPHAAGEGLRRRRSRVDGTGRAISSATATGF